MSCSFFQDSFGLFCDIHFDGFQAVLDSVFNIFLTFLGDFALIFFIDAFRIVASVLGAFKLRLIFQRWYVLMNLGAAS